MFIEILHLIDIKIANQPSHSALMNYAEIYVNLRQSLYESLQPCIISYYAKFYLCLRRLRIHTH